MHTQTKEEHIRAAYHSPKKGRANKRLHGGLQGSRLATPRHMRGKTGEGSTETSYVIGPLAAAVKAHSPLLLNGKATAIGEDFPRIGMIAMVGGKSTFHTRGPAWMPHSTRPFRARRLLPSTYTSKSSRHWPPTRKRVETPQNPQQSTPQPTQPSAIRLKLR